jgi:hypothetical protein
MSSRKISQRNKKARLSLCVESNKLYLYTSQKTEINSVE